MTLQNIDLSPTQYPKVQCIVTFEGKTELNKKNTIWQIYEIPLCRFVIIFQY